MLRYDYGSRKLVGKGESRLTFRRIHLDPSLESDHALAFLHLILGSLKLIEEGESKLAFLRRIDDPPLTDGSDYRMAFLRYVVGSHN